MSKEFIQEDSLRVNICAGLSMPEEEEEDEARQHD